MSTIKAVLFDFGGVFTVSPFGAVESLANERGHDVMEFAEVVFGSYHLDTDHPWHQLERGEITLEQSREDIIELGKQKGIEIDLWDVLMRMAEHNDGKVVNDEVVALLEDVKRRGYHTAIVTNNVREFADGWQSMIPLEAVDHIVDSSELGKRKPGADIYHAAVAKLDGIAHGQCVFLDDVEANVEGARALGMHGILVTPQAAETVANLNQLLAQFEG